jgi:(2Fe-2S) ferredoxin
MSPTAEFALVGQLSDFVLKEGYKIKYLRIAAQEREYWIKLPKELRHQLDPAIAPGSWLKIRGIQERCRKTGKLKLMADSVSLWQEELGVTDNNRNYASRSSNSAKNLSILLCQKSSCRKRGGEAVCQAIAANLQERGLEEQVKIKPVGCLKQCKQGPNLVIMPDKARYSHLNCQQIPALLEKHLNYEL